MAQKRIQKELLEIEKDQSIINFSVCLIDENQFHWQATIIGPEGSPYADGVFTLNIDIPQDYPLRPPKIFFITKIYHPNVTSNGSICLDLLKDSWVPNLTISKALIAIYTLLGHPEPENPL